MTEPYTNIVPIDGLKKCPFCGSEADRQKKEYRSATGERRDYFAVWCKGCKASTTWYSTKSHAVDAWNRRASDGKGQEEN